MVKCIHLAAAVAVFACAMVGAETTRAQSYPARYPRMAPAHALLYKCVDKIEWDDTTLTEIVDWLRFQADGRVNVLPRWGALRTAGLNESTSVTLELRNTNVAEVLGEVIEQLAPVGALAYRAYNNRFVLSSRADFDRQLYLRVYDVKDLLHRVENNGQGAPVLDLSQTTGGGSSQTGLGGAGATAGTVFGGGGQESGSANTSSEQDQEEQLQDLIQLIQTVIEPASWASAGQSGRGQIRAFNQSIIVLNTIEVHEALAGSFVYGR